MAQIVFQRNAIAGFMIRFLAILPLLFMISCVTMPLKAADTSNPINTIAVLPVYNASNDLNGPVMLRNMVVAQLNGLRYSVMPIEDVDPILRDQMGVTLGEQLDLTTPKALGEYLGVDAVIYIYLLNFDDKTTGLYNVKKVRAGLKLINTKNGTVIWSKGQGTKSVLISNKAGEVVVAIADKQDREAGLEEFSTIKGISGIPNLTDWWNFPIERVPESGQGGLGGILADAAIGAILSLGEKVVTNALGTHLWTESDKMLSLIFDGFQNGPGRQVYGVSYVAVPPTMPNAASYELPGALIIDYIAKGKGEFNAEFYLSLGKDGKLDAAASGMVAKAGNNFLCELDMTAYVTQKKEMPKALVKTINLRRIEDGRILNLYPLIKKYYDRAATDSDKSGPTVTKESVGEEDFDSHRCVKQKLSIVTSDGRTLSALSYEAKDLNGFPLKVEFENNGIKGVFEFKNVFMSAPSSSRFQVAGGYEREFKFDGFHAGKKSKKASAIGGVRKAKDKKLTGNGTKASAGSKDGKQNKITAGTSNDEKKDTGNDSGKITAPEAAASEQEYFLQ